jgi:DNA-directed RNA polymerase specialized sigma subunit
MIEDFAAERQRLKELAAEVDAETRRLIPRLVDRGLGYRDIGRLLGISAARVSQIVREQR